MAATLTHVGNNPARSDIKRFMCLTVDDINTLPRQGIAGTMDDTNFPGCNEPCGIGSEAIVKTGEIYLLWPDNKWAPF